MGGSGWNATRRNRNIGTSTSGHGQDNHLVIPQRWSDDRVFWEKLRDPVLIRRVMHGRECVVLVEPVINGYTHCCTPDDVFAIVEEVPSEDLDELRLFVLRQPTRKQATISPVWGRLAYFAELGSLKGPAVYLEAQELNRVWRRQRSMSVEGRREFERLLSDGHQAEQVPSGYRWTLDHAASRSTQLYRTLLHEIGHQVDYLNSVQRPRDCPEVGAGETDQLSENYWRLGVAMVGEHPEVPVEPYVDAARPHHRLVVGCPHPPGGKRGLELAVAEQHGRQASDSGGEDRQSRLTASKLRQMSN